MNTLNQKAINKLEYMQVMNRLSEYAVSYSAKQTILKMVPISDYISAVNLLNQTLEADKYITMYNICPDYSFDSINDIAEKAVVNSTLSMGELLKVKRMLKISRLIHSQLSTPINECHLLFEMAEAIYSNKPIEDSIDFAIISEDEMNDRASPELYSLRNAIRRTNQDIKEKLDGYIRSSETSKYMQDSIVTIRSDRYVIPVKQEFKNNVSGIIHDQSASGATVFIEPIAIVNLNNQLRQQIIEEAREVERILKDFTAKVRVFALELVRNEQIVTSLDCIYARAHYAHATKSQQPKLNNKGFIHIVEGRHPLLNPATVVPVSIKLGDTYNIVVITGPNTGGKTVSLKLVGLFTLMAESGLFIPCQYCELSIFTNVWCDIGDEQSIEQSLSTFSSHITNISNITKELTSDSLILLDELGAGTEPNEGAALAIAITQFILSSGARAVLTTHYSQLKEYSLTTDGIENASMEFNPVTFVPTYKLVLGIPGSSNAIEIAKRLGLNEEIIKFARSNLSAESISFENILRHAEQIRQQSQEELSQTMAIKGQLADEKRRAQIAADNLENQRDLLLKNSKSEAKRIVTDALSQTDELLSQVKDLVNRGLLEEKELFNARKIIGNINDLKYDTETAEIAYEYGTSVDINKLKPQDIVYVPSLNSQATVLSIKKNKAELQVGKVRTLIDISMLYYPNTTNQTKGQTSSHNIKTEIKTRVAPTEINLLGYNVEDAIAEVDAFIDNAIICNLLTIRVVHGMGTGALRSGLHRHFATHPSIDSYRLGKHGEGDSGVTILSLK